MNIRLNVGIYYLLSVQSRVGSLVYNKLVILIKNFYGNIKIIGISIAIKHWQNVTVISQF